MLENKKRHIRKPIFKIFVGCFGRVYVYNSVRAHGGLATLPIDFFGGEGGRW